MQRLYCSIVLGLSLGLLLGCGGGGGGGSDESTDDPITTVDGETDTGSLPSFGRTAAFCSLDPELDEALRRAVQIWHERREDEPWTETLAPGQRRATRTLTHEVGHFLIGTTNHDSPEGCIMHEFHNPMSVALCPEDMASLPADPPDPVLTDDVNACDVAVQWYTPADDPATPADESLHTGLIWDDDGDGVWDTIGLNTRWDWFLP